MNDTKTKDFESKEEGSNKAQFQGKRKDAKGKGNGRGRKSERNTNRAHHSASDGITNNANIVRLSDVTALNFDYPITYNLGELNALGVVIPERNIFTCGYMPTLGTDVGANRAAQRMYGEIRREMNLSSIAEAGDYMMYCEAVCSLDILVEFLKRVVRLANSYLYKNNLFPRCALKALGFDLDEVIANAAMYRSEINSAIAAMKYLSLPYTYASHSYRLQMNKYVYADSPNPKAQNIMFYPMGFWKWNLAAGTAEEPSDLEWVESDFGSTGINLDSMRELLRNLTDALISDTDAQKIHGDFLKCYGDSLISLGGEYITENEQVEVVYDPQLLYMLHNATIFEDMGDDAPKISWHIASGSTSPTFAQDFRVMSRVQRDDKSIIDLPLDHVTPIDVAEMCRWKAWTRVATNKLAQGDTNAKVSMDDLDIVLPLEILVKFSSYYFVKNSDGSISKYADEIPTHFIINETNLNMVHQLDTLSVAPTCYGISLADGDDGAITEVFGDRDTFTIVDAEYIRRLHTVYTELNYNL